MLKNVNIKNYTSSVASSRSVDLIEKALVDLGARNIMKEYDGFGKINAIAFSIPEGTTGMTMPFKLPVRIEPLVKLFLNGKRYPSTAQKKTAEEQAERTAWKNTLEWVQLQATMIKLEQVEFIEVFLPYAYSFETKQTLFQKFKESGFKQLT